MSSNLELIRAAFADDGLFDRVKSGEGVPPIYTEKSVIDVRDFDATPDVDPIYVGLEAIERFWIEWFAPWESMTWRAEFYERGPWVLADVVEFVVRGGSSGIELEMPHAQTYLFRDGLVDVLRIHQARRTAFLEAGIKMPR